MILTPLECFLKWEKETPDKIFLRQPVDGEWHTYTFREAGLEIRKVASFLRGLALPADAKVAILSKNCAHWLMADLAIMMAGLISVPIYPTLSASGVGQILRHSESAAVFLGKLDDFESQRPAIPENMHRISFPLYGITEGNSWKDILAHADPAELPRTPGHDQLATIMYSSGTTGTPKGVMLTHGAFAFVGEQVKTYLKVTPADRFFSYLPLSHIAERGLMEMVALAGGSSISFAETLEKFAANLQHEQPTIFGGVPRIYSKFQEGVLKKIPQKTLSRLLSIPLVNSILKKSVIRKLGLNQARVIVCGAAPSPVSLLLWFKSLGIEVREMYGMTENTAFSHANFLDVKIGTVGQPWPGAEVTLGDEGEILVRHAALMKGYFKDEYTTAQVFNTEGFLKTGDQGTIDKDGFLTITGRIKDQFKTDKAKFVAPAPIEIALLSDPHVEQVIVVGNGLPQPIAIIVPSVFARSQEKKIVMESLDNTMKQVNATLEGYEQLQKIVVVNDNWTLENGLLTPSLKLKRNEVEKIYSPKYRMWYDRAEPVILE